jgi:hypothetical protein
MAACKTSLARRGFNIKYYNVDGELSKPQTAMAGERRGAEAKNLMQRRSECEN